MMKNQSQSEIHKDTFFSQTNCDRCQNDLSSGRTTSWFTEETICMECSSKESEIKSQLPKGGRNHEGCGHIPKVS